MKRHTVLTMLVCLTVILAGCSGWGTDGPTDDEVESDDADDLEEVNDDAGADDTGSDDADDASSDDADDANENGEQTESDTDESDDEPAESDDGDGADDGEADDTEGTDDAEDGSDEGDDSENGADDGDGEGDNDGATLTVETADVVTGDSVNADVITLEHDGETVDEASGESATFDGLADGEYDLELQDSFGDWAYGDTITIDGEDATHVAEIDQGHTYWPQVVATVVDGDGDPVEGETVTFNDNPAETDADGTASYELESSYTDERTITVEYGDQTETFEFDWESWDNEPETVTFEAENGDDDENMTLLVA